MSFFFFFLWQDPEMASRAKVVINQLKGEDKLLQREIEEIQTMRNINY